MPTSNRDPLPQRLAAGKKNLDLFLLGAKSSPVCFYFEDEGCEELYTRLLVRLFPRYARPLVVCTGGKTRKQVLKEAEEQKLSPVVFVQDKDFDDLIGTLPTDPRIVTLHRYSFENYLLDPDALVELAIESKRRLRREDAIQELSLADYFSTLYDGYRPLAALFVVARRLNLRKVKTTKQPIGNLVGKGATSVSEESLGRFREEVARAALAIQRIATQDELLAMVEPALALEAKPQYLHHADLHPNAHLCGKHLLDLTLLYVDSKVGTDLREADRFEIAMRLVVHVSLAVFERVRESILGSIKTQKAPQAVLDLMA